MKTKNIRVDGQRRDYASPARREYYAKRRAARFAKRFA